MLQLTWHVCGSFSATDRARFRLNHAFSSDVCYFGTRKHDRGALSCLTGSWRDSLLAFILEETCLNLI